VCSKQSHQGFLSAWSTFVIFADQVSHTRLSRWSSPARSRIAAKCLSTERTFIAWMDDVRMNYGDAIIVDGLRTLELDKPGAKAAAVYDREIGLRTLYVDAASGQEHYLIRYPAGTRGRLHRHSVAHTILVLEGRLDANGRVIGPGAYAHFPAGEAMRHQATGDGPCLFVVLFHGPFDVEIVDDQQTG